MDDFQKSLGELEEVIFGMNDPETVKPKKNEQDKTAMFQEALGGIQTKADIILCLDATSSMSPILDSVKNLALSFYDELIEVMRKDYSRIVNQLRVKVIVFRDYYCDDAMAMKESEFFVLPRQKKEFHDFVASIQAKGGGDEPENALEALALAMRSDWVTTENYNTEKIRNVVVMFTDASAHPLEQSVDGVTEYYPRNMLKTYEELYDAWNTQGNCGKKNEYLMDPRAERLIIFAPQDVYPWNRVEEEFRNTAVVSIAAAHGGSDLAKKTIISTISGSMK